MSCDSNVCCGTVDGPCNTNADCCGGNACSPDNTCKIVLGQCYCGTDTDCSTGECSSDYTQCVCSEEGAPCTSPKNCCSGLCGGDAGTCLANHTLDGPCSGAGTCSPEEECQGSTCCIPTAATEACKDDGDCCEKACDFSLSFTGFGVCCGKLHQSCKSNLDCCVFFACSDGTCKLHTGGLGYGLFCHNDDECVSGLCSGTKSGGCPSGNCTCTVCNSDLDCPPSSLCVKGACTAPDAG